MRRAFKKNRHVPSQVVERLNAQTSWPHAKRSAAQWNMVAARSAEPAGAIPCELFRVVLWLSTAYLIQQEAVSC